MAQVISLGGAHMSETGGINGEAGDSTGKEVSVANYTSIEQVKHDWKGGVVYRPVDPKASSAMSKIMITACNNPNIGYSQGSRTGIFKGGCDAEYKVNADCSSLVTYCSNVGAGTNLETNTTTANMANRLAASGQYFEAVPISSIHDLSALKNGDIILKNGHVEMVCAGSPREGVEDEIPTYSYSTSDIANAGSSYSGDGVAVRQYRNAFGSTFEFTPRIQEPLKGHMSEEKEKKLKEFYYNDDLPDWNAKYAWGRFSEIMDQKCDLSRGPGTTWYIHTEDGYQRGMAPQVGSVMCFSSGSAPLRIVEEVNADSISVSWMPKDSKSFYYSKMIKNANGSWDLYDNKGAVESRMQGFIYNPGLGGVGGGQTFGNTVVPGGEGAGGQMGMGGYISGTGGGMTATTWSALYTFIENAKSHVGEDGSFVQRMTNRNTENSAWSAAFIVAVAIETGSTLNIIIPNTFSCSDIGRVGINRNMGTWFDGPAQGGNPPVQPGDIILFRTQGSSANRGKMTADKAGIVVEAGNTKSSLDAGVGMSLNSDGGLGTNETAGGSFQVVIGDWDGQVVKRSYTSTSEVISGVFRPNWDQIDGTSESVQQYYTKEGIYTEGTSKEDAAIRDLRWITVGKDGFEPSISSTGVLLCAINYTGMIANMYSALAEVASSSATDANLVVDLWNNSVESSFQTAQNEQKNAIGGSSGQLVDSGSMSGDISSGLVPGEQSTGGGSYQITSGSSVKLKIVYTDGRGTRNATLTMNGTYQACYNALMRNLGNEAAAIGVIANFCQEAGEDLDPGRQIFDKTAGGGGGYGGGLIGWTNTTSKYGTFNYFDMMKQYCAQNGGDWHTNVQGQIDFIFYMANQTQKSTRGNMAAANTWAHAGVDKLRGVSRSVAGAQLAAEIFYSHWVVGQGNAQKYMDSGTGTARVIAEYGARKQWAVGLWKLFFGGK